MATMDQLVTAFQNARKAGDDAAARRLAKAIKSMQQQPVDRSFTSAFQQGLDAPLENMATTARMLGAEGTADTLSGLTEAPQNYESAAGRFINPQEGDFTIGGYAPGFLPRAAVEQAGQMAGSLATRAGGAAVGSMFGPKGTVAGALAGPALFEFVQQLGPIAAERARNNGRAEPAWEDWTAAAGAAGVSGALNALGVSGGRGASFLNKTMREGVTETSQSVVEQTGSTAGTEAGLQIDPRQAIGEGIIGGTTAGGFDVAGRVVNKGTRIFTGAGQVSDPEAAASLAQRLDGIIKANDINVNDLDKRSTKGARQAVDLAHSQLGADMRELIDELKVKLKVDRLDPAETVAKKVLAEAGVAEARTKTKSIVGQQEFTATEDLVGDTAEGQRLLQLFRESNELTNLHNSGYVGGLSQFTDQLSPFASNVGYTARSAAELPTRMLATGVGATFNPAIPAAQAAAVGTGRAVDALTGRRSRVGRYIRQNQGNQGVQSPQMPSLRAAAIAQDEADQRAAAAEEQRQDALRLDALRAGDPPKGDPNDPNPSPEYQMFSATGLNNRRDVSDLLEALRKSRPLLRPAINSYNRMLRKGTQVKDLSKLIAAAKGYADKNPQMFPNRQPIAALPGAAAAATEAPGYLRGIEANRRAIADAKDQVDNDNSLSLFDKQLTKQTLDQMGGNLGLQPADTANELMNRAVDAARDKAKVKSYLQPYVDRVERQQKNRPETSEPVIEPFLDLRAPSEAPPKRSHREIGELLMGEQTDRYGRELNPYNDGGDFETVANAMTDEARMQFEKMPDAANWYDDDVREALATTAEVIPEIEQSADNKQLYLLLAAVTSVGHKPRINWRYAGSLAMHYFRTGQIGERGQVFSEKRGTSEERTVNPTTGKVFGLKAQSIEPGINIIGHMINKLGVAGTLDWVRSDKTKKEIDAMRKEAGYGPQSKIKGGMNAVVPGIQMFGPKVGPFFMNLNGIHEVTVDLWASRTVRRHAGGLLAPNFDPTAKKGSADTGLVDAPTELERPTMKDLFTRVGDNLGVTPQAAQAILWAYEQELYNDLGATLEYEKFSEGAEKFREQDALAYEERYPRSAAGQGRGGTRDVPPETVEGSRQFTFDFGDSEPGRSQPDPGRQDLPTGLAGSRPATTEQIRDVKPVTDAMFEIGKPGGEFEDGIKDLDTATKLAKALGAAFYVVGNQTELGKVFGRKGKIGGKDFMMGGAMMNPDPSKDTMDPRTRYRQRAVVGVMGEYKNPRNPKHNVTPIEAVYNALHEVGHVIEGSFVPGETATKPGKYYQRFSDQQKVTSNRLYDNTFRQAIGSLLDAAAGMNVKGYSQQDATDILNEIVSLQRTGVLDDGSSMVRGSYKEYNDAIDAAEAAGNMMRARSLELQLMKAEDQYLQTPQELAADLIGYYLMSPQRAKQLMPKATKLVRDLMNSSKVVTFYSLPLASLVAAIFANMLVAEGEEEQQQAALTLGRGALSA